MIILCLVINYAISYNLLLEKNSDFNDTFGDENNIPLGLEFENDDAAWVMACTFIIFTMQTGMNHESAYPMHEIMSVYARYMKLVVFTYT